MRNPSMPLPTLPSAPTTNIAATQRAIDINFAFRAAELQRRLDDNTIDPLIAAVDRAFAKAGRA